MKIHQKVEVSHLRVYEEGCSYEDKDEYLLILTVHYLGDNEVWISGAKGTYNRHIDRQIKKFLSEQGIKVLRYDKSKRLKLLSREYSLTNLT